MRIIGLTEEVEFNIEGIPQLVTLAIEYVEHKHSKHYWIEAITQTGFDLCNPPYGYIKQNIERNTRLRTDKAIVNDMHSVLEAYINTIKGMENEILLTQRVVNGNISGNTVYGDQSHWVHFEVCNLKSLQSRQGISWHSHNVYKQGSITMLVERDTTGQLRYYVNENDLYDLDLLRALRNTDTFRSQKYAFFSYNEVLRLLGEDHGNTKELSGLFSNAEKSL